MIDFLNRLFGRQPSGATAKERLRLVLMSDHLSLAPEMVECMKRDLVDVISRYVEVDRDKIDVHFENQHNALAMLANIPITGVNRNTTPATQPALVQPAEKPAEEPVDAAPEAPAAPSSSRSGSRKRRKKTAGAPPASPSAAAAT